MSTRVTAIESTCEELMIRRNREEGAKGRGEVRDEGPKEEAEGREGVAGVKRAVAL